MSTPSKVCKRCRKYIPANLFPFNPITGELRTICMYCYATHHRKKPLPPSELKDHVSKWDVKRYGGADKKLHNPYRKAIDELYGQIDGKPPVPVEECFMCHKVKPIVGYDGVIKVVVTMRDVRELPVHYNVCEVCAGDESVIMELKEIDIGAARERIAREMLKQKPVISHDKPTQEKPEVKDPELFYKDKGDPDEWM